MDEIAIDVRGLSKRYVIGAKREGYTTLRDSLASAVRSAFRRGGRFERPSSREFWALKDVTFQIGRGEIVGVIGRNGAGKSTLLKILSRITDPTTGEIDVDGRAGSLLEVGTGFHPELTGRENIYLNGAILGMSRRDIVSKFDEIVAFAEVERFLDTPVKYYSSGMYVRLAFAVAAHLDPEILFVDEVLSVGDVQFQKKCLGKMRDISSLGRTVIFVSHNMGAVRTLCETGLYLRDGCLVGSGPIGDVIADYMDDSSEGKKSPTVSVPKPTEDLTVWMESATILGNGEPSCILEIGDKISLEVNFRANRPIQKPIIGYVIRSSRGESVINANNLYLSSSGYATPVTEGTIICDLGDLPLMAGSYFVSLWLCPNQHEQHEAQDVLYFTIEEKDVWGNGALPPKSISHLWWPTQFRFRELSEVNRSCLTENAES